MTPVNAGLDDWGDRAALRHAGLVVIDLQNDFCHPAGAVARLRGVDVGPCAALAARIAALAHTVRKGGRPVVWVTAEYDRRFLSGPALLRRHGEPEADDICRKGSWGAELMMPPHPGDIVIAKHRYSAFYETELETLLERHGVRSPILTGVTTNTCVMATALDASYRGLFPILVSDCVWAANPERHEATLADAARLYADVTTSEDLRALWRSA